MNVDCNVENVERNGEERQRGERRVDLLSMGLRMG